MRIRYHIVASAVISALSYLATGRLESALILFSTGSFVDIDHVLDYYLAHRKLTINTEDLVNEGNPHYLVLHSIELLIALGFLTVIYQEMTYLSVSYTAHLAMDIVGNTRIKNHNRLNFYSTLYRWKNRWCRDT